jgi:hypothetical protein
MRLVIMATLPTPEDSARKILAIFKSHNVRPDNVLMAGAVNIAFTKGGRTAAEYTEGLKYAEAKGWIETGPNSSIKLTSAGFAEM